VKHLTKRIEELIESWHLAPLVKAFQGMRGISLISAVTLAAEVCDFARLESAPKFMSYVGLFPSEYSSGGGRNQGPITHAGNGFVRRVLVEAAWIYQFPARMSAVTRSKQRASGRDSEDRLACAGEALRALPEAHRRREEQGRHRHRPRAGRLRLVYCSPPGGCCGLMCGARTVRAAGAWGRPKRSLRQPASRARHDARVRIGRRPRDRYLRADL
jgi:hypothetical protein